MIMKIQQFPYSYSVPPEGQNAVIVSLAGQKSHEYVAVSLPHQPAIQVAYVAPLSLFLSALAPACVREQKE